MKLFGRKTPAQPRDVHLFNTESNALEIFAPIKQSTVTMYSCGPTVYDYAHIGNLRSYVCADMVKRVLIRNGYTVRHTINFTDFGHLSDDGDTGEDKMMKGLTREGLEISFAGMRTLGDTYITAFLDDIDELRILPPTTWARASDYIGKQISLIKMLDDKGFVYETSDGAYFDISAFPSYGRLGNIDVANLKSGARVQGSPEKRHPADFAVWKKSELGFPSRFGKGFPGWHIECSAMALETLGKQIDIHTGGIDHVAVHHNAEIAQSEAVTNRQFVRYWLHNEFITIDNTKIAKSLGNGITMRHLRDRGFSGDDYRYWLLTAHYRSPINFSFDALRGAKQALYRLKRYMYEDFKRRASIPDARYLEQFDTHLAHDFDTPKALAVLWDMIADNSLSSETKCGTLLAMDEVLGIGLSDDLKDGVRSLGVVAADDLPPDILALINKREVARTVQNWAEADFIRDALLRKGYSIDDTPQGPKISQFT